MSTQFSRRAAQAKTGVVGRKTVQLFSDSGNLDTSGDERVRIAIERRRAARASRAFAKCGDGFDPGTGGQQSEPELVTTSSHDKMSAWKFSPTSLKRGFKECMGAYEGCGIFADSGPYTQTTEVARLEPDGKELPICDKASSR